MIKKHKILFSSLYIIITFALFALIVKKSVAINFSYELAFLFTAIDLFVLMHLILDIKKMYDFIFKKRYIIGVTILLILVIGEYNGSSTSLWNNYIEPEYQIENSIVFGEARPIRSDEWRVGTPLSLSQASKTVNFSSHNEVLGATDNLVTLFPNFPSKDLSIIATPNKIGYLFLDTEKAFSLAWYLPFFILFFASFELFMILSKKKRFLSLAGAVLITFSPIVSWWQSTNIMAYGALAVVLFYQFLMHDNWKIKLPLAIIFGYVGFLYIMCMYPAWQIPYGYCYLILLIWIISQNKDKLHKKDLLYLIPVILVIVAPIVYIFIQNRDVMETMTSTVYPGARKIKGSFGIFKLLFTYVANMFYPYEESLQNFPELSQYISLFPIPFFFGLYLIIKNKKQKKDLFLILCSVVTIFLSVFVIFKLPGIITKVTLMSMSTTTRTISVIGYLSIIELIYILANYEINKKIIIKNKKNILIAIISIISIFVIVKISNHVLETRIPGCLNLYTSLTSLVIFTIICYLILYNHKKSNIVLCLILIIVSLVSTLPISPLNKGLNVFYDKPFAKKIRKLVKNDKNSVFLAVNNGGAAANYIAANGGKTINTTNYVPNLKLYHYLDKEKKYEKVYNRYEHVSVKLIDGKTKFKLAYPDQIIMKLSYDDVCKIKVDYIVDGKDSNLDRYEKIYENYNLEIYKTNCKN